jgi:DNA-binding NarL/FixJ family response regulator
LYGKESGRSSTEERPQWEVCGEAKSAQEALDASRNLKPDVTVLDITMPGISGLEVASTIVELGSRVLMFTMHESEQLATEVSQAGAQGFVLKSQAGKDLIRAIERLLSGGTFFGSEPNPQEDAHSDEPSSGKLADQSSDGRVSLFSFGVPATLSFRLHVSKLAVQGRYNQNPFLSVSSRSLQGIAERPLPCDYNVIQFVCALSRHRRGFKSRRGRHINNLGEKCLLSV